MSPELVRLEVARDLATMRNSIEQLAAKQEQMAQNIATLRAAEQDIMPTKSSPALSEAVSPPPRKKARRVAPRELAAQSSMSPPTFTPQ
jgi:transcriptional regulator of NAD metabolism